MSYESEMDDLDKYKRITHLLSQLKESWESGSEEWYRTKEISELEELAKVITCLEDALEQANSIRIMLSSLLQPVDMVGLTIYLPKKDVDELKRRVAEEGCKSVGEYILELEKTIEQLQEDPHDNMY